MDQETNSLPRIFGILLRPFELNSARESHNPTDRGFEALSPYRNGSHHTPTSDD